MRAVARKKPKKRKRLTREQAMGKIVENVTRNNKLYQHLKEKEMGYGNAMSRDNRVPEQHFGPKMAYDAGTMSTTNQAPDQQQSMVASLIMRAQEQNTGLQRILERMTALSGRLLGEEPIDKDGGPAASHHSMLSMLEQTLIAGENIKDSIFRQLSRLESL